MTGMSAAGWTATWTPRRPLATDDLALGCWRQSREQALERRYLEHSPKALLSMLVVDVDHRDTLMRAISLPRHHPEPSWVAEGVSGRGHVGWVLSAPVCRTDAGRPEPLAFAARVQEGLRRALDGDAGYAGLLTKNPTHEGWYPTWGRAQPYELRDLATGLGDLLPRTLPKRATEATGLGRNVHLFDGLRTWAYRARYRYDDRLEWEQTVLAVALGINVEFAVPLPSAEVTATAQSVARWVWRKLSREGLIVVQTVRGRRRAAQPSAAEARSKGGTRGAATTNGLSSPAVVDGRVRGGQVAGRMRTPAQVEASRRNLLRAQQALTVKRTALRDAIREGGRSGR
ncbi:replication initiation protein [Kineococcus rubinsiae]|uniref:replication initiation protein n=1 Tax=Kineococcus rubinsiae TaxID=2609562 RepID=UPI00143143B0|nr:replication initiation protein [Kineococcus rubinsiae]NIZ93490.1 replication protein RepA [Kineococcus rubinsiae]